MAEEKRKAAELAQKKAEEERTAREKKLEEEKIALAKVKREAEMKRLQEVSNSKRI